LIRISEAFAKMKLSSYVEEDDVNMAFELIKDALKQSATDPTTGMIDMDVIVTGHTSASRRRVDLLVELLNK
jgi:DNA replication licensing factor MCM4